jgi:hypothetical protein
LTVSDPTSPNPPVTRTVSAIRPPLDGNDILDKREYHIRR